MPQSEVSFFLRVERSGESFPVTGDGQVEVPNEPNAIEMVLSAPANELALNVQPSAEWEQVW